MRAHEHFESMRNPIIISYTRYGKSHNDQKIAIRSFEEALRLEKRNN
jgi:hypothetical protein